MLKTRVINANYVQALAEEHRNCYSSDMLKIYSNKKLLLGTPF